MLGELLKAIKTRWTAKSLATTFTGGIHESRAPSSTSYPCVTIDIVGSSNTARSSSETSNKFNQYETVTFDLTVHSKTGLAATSALVETLKAAFDNAVLTLTDDTVTLKKLWYTGESMDSDPDHPNFRDWTVTYQAVLEQAKTLVPT